MQSVNVRVLCGDAGFTLVQSIGILPVGVRIRGAAGDQRFLFRVTAVSSLNDRHNAVAACNVCCTKDNMMECAWDRR